MYINPLASVFEAPHLIHFLFQLVLCRLPNVIVRGTLQVGVEEEGGEGEAS